MTVVSLSRARPGAAPSVHNPDVAGLNPAGVCTSTNPPCSPDALLGITWWNRISRAQRAHWLEVAESFVPADAWAAFKRGGR
jgi:hypothetical protein